MSIQHEKIVDCVLKDYSDGKIYKLYKNHNGTAKLKNGQTIKYGLGVGTPDIIGYHVPSCRWVGIEVKTANYPHLSKEQKFHLLNIKKDGGLAYVARQVFTKKLYKMYDIEDYLNEYTQEKNASGQIQ